MPFVGWRGNLFSFLADPIAYMSRAQREYGDLFLFVRGRRGMVFGIGAEYNQQFLSDAGTFANVGITFQGPKNSSQWRLGLTLLNMNAEQHRRARQVVAAPFYTKEIVKYVPSVKAMTGRLIAGWKPGETKDICAEMKTLIKQIAADILFGLEDDPTAFDVADSFDAWHHMSNSASVRVLRWNTPLTPYGRLLRYAEKLEAKVRLMIAKRRAKGLEGGNDVLSLLLSAHDAPEPRLSDDELIGLTGFVFNASFETTAHALTWTFFLLAQHPEEAARLHEELQGLEDDAWEKIAALPYLDAVLKESMRLFPPPVYSYRVCTKDVKVGPYLLPKGTPVFHSHYLTHRSPQVFEDPKRFRPERWESQQPSPFEYLPFGYGAHSCLGGALATMMMKIIVAMALKARRLQVVPDARIDRHVVVTLGVKRGMPMKVFEQDGRYENNAVPVRGNVHEMVKLERGTQA